MQASDGTLEEAEDYTGAGHLHGTVDAGACPPRSTGRQARCTNDG